MSRDSRIGLPLSSDSTTAEEALCAGRRGRGRRGAGRAPWPAERPPPRLRGARRATARSTSAGSSLRHRAERRARCRGSPSRRSRPRPGPHAADEQAEARGAPRATRRPSLRRLGRGAVRHGGEDVRDRRHEDLLGETGGAHAHRMPVGRRVPSGHEDARAAARCRPAARWRRSGRGPAGATRSPSSSFIIASQSSASLAARMPPAGLSPTGARCARGSPGWRAPSRAPPAGSR